MSHTFLEFFYLFDIFLAGAVFSVALRHAYAHYRPHASAEHQPPAGGHLPPSVREHLLEEAQANFETVLRGASRDLQKDLQATADDIKTRIESLSKEARAKELDHYKLVAAELQKQTKEDISSVDKDLAAQKAELKAKLASEIAAEKQRLISQIDTKLADAVTSFLLEALGREVDLGAQGAYLTKLLEDHKADFAREVSGEQN